MPTNFQDRLDIEKVWPEVQPLVEKMKAKYPEGCNIEGLEPALTNDVCEIYLLAYNKGKEEGKAYKGDYGRKMCLHGANEERNRILAIGEMLKKTKIEWKGTTDVEKNILLASFDSWNAAIDIFIAHINNK